MHKGSCGCGALQLHLSGDPLAIGLCHCEGCRKLSGAPFTYNLIVRLDDLSITTGSPKEVAKTADSGNAVKNFFCGDCGSPLFGGTLSSDGTLDTIVLRAGVLDDIGFLHESAPTVEIYTCQRLKWMPALPGCTQVEGMLPAE